MVDAAMSFRARDADAMSPSSAETANGQSVSVAAATEEALAAYGELSAGGLAAPAQGADWIGQWVRHAHPDALIAIVRSGGKPVYALALEVVRIGPFRMARFMGGRHANGNFAAADAAFLAAAGAADMLAMVAAIRKARPDIDILALERLLPDLDGAPNPLLALPHYPSPNLSLAVDLQGGFDALLARASGKRKRKKHRSQTRKFEAAGGYRRIEARTPAETARLLEAFYAMKEFRFRKMGIANVFGDAAVRSFFHELFASSLGRDQPPFVLHGLEVAGKLRAVTGSSRCGKRLICEFGAISEDELAHASPGDFLFFDNIGEACRDRLDVYDFSVGDEPYKRLWCDIETQHLDVIVPLTARGRLMALQMRAYARAKAFVKNSPLIWKITKRLRKRAAGQPQPAED
jgi:CelD/BcsL family acetyltransferase involved in cellulose biosynthesis